ncbi:S-adenosyl-L-methionine-dependent methyltransferase [Xylaria flabelliformis]|nr:S-adenosyl-L-methionine-dependent methyltransferase [Xylaria flabelliformis]
MSCTTKSITELAFSISTNTKIVNDYYVANNLPLPSFDINSPRTIAIPASEKEVSAAHAQIIADSFSLHNVLKGPNEMLMGLAANNVNDTLSLQAMRRFKVAEKFGLDEKVSFEFLSQACDVNIVDLSRLIRHAMTNHIFREDENGLVAHTAASRVLRENVLLTSLVGILTEELFPGAPHTLDALVKFDGFHAPEHSGFSLGHHTDKGLYEELRAYPDRAQRFAGAMSGFAAVQDLTPLSKGWDWVSVDSRHGTVVDIGGGWGPVCIGLAKAYPNINFVVQDFEDVVTEGPDHVPAELEGRIKFQSYNFLEQVQPITDATVYYMRAILHNWPDPYCVKILKHIIPSLDKDAHILVQDWVLGDPWTLPAYTEKYFRSWDLNMTTFFGSRERTFADWEKLIKKADDKLSVRLVQIGADRLLDITWA